MATISAKKVGKTVIARIDRKNYSKQVSVEEYKELKKMIEDYTEKPTEKKKKEIIKMLTPVATEKKKGFAAKVKEVVKKVKQEKVTKTTKEDALKDLGARIDSGEVSEQEMKSLMSKFKTAEEAAPKAEETRRPYSGETYRRN